jgi:cation:H+ antiporter
MTTDLIFLGFGLAALVGGGHALVGGAVSLASRMGISPLLVGLTVVAFGTSTPELVVNVVAALRHSTEIGFGNVVGSNTANIGLLLAVTAVITPLAVHRTLVVREIPMMILACGAALVLAGGPMMGEESSGYGRGEGLMLLLLFAVFLYYTFGEALEQRATSAPVQGATMGREAQPAPGRRSGGVAAVLILGGLGLLIAGGDLTVRGASGLANQLGVSESVIGLTIVAVGTSLPEFATTLTAALRGAGDIALGNIVGSNIFNLLFVWGLSLVIAPSDVPDWGSVDLLVMTAFSVALLPFVISQSRLGRVEGALLLAGYLGYVGWLAVR